MTEKTLRGTLFLDVATVSTAPGFFSLMSLVMRAAGMEICVVGRTPLGDAAGIDETAARMGVGFTSCHTYPGTPQSPGYASWKHFKAMEATKLGPVIWPDVDLNANWRGPAVDNVPGLTILNWAAVLKGGDAGTAQPQSVARG